MSDFSPTTAVRTVCSILQSCGSHKVAFGCLLRLAPLAPLPRLLGLRARASDATAVFTTQVVLFSLSIADYYWTIPFFGATLVSVSLLRIHLARGSAVTAIITRLFTLLNKGSRTIIQALQKWRGNTTFIVLETAVWVEKRRVYPQLGVHFHALINGS